MGQRSLKMGNPKVLRLDFIKKMVHFTKVLIFLIFIYDRLSWFITFDYRNPKTILDIRPPKRILNEIGGGQYISHNLLVKINKKVLKCFYKNLQIPSFSQIWESQYIASVILIYGKSINNSKSPIPKTISIFVVF